MCQGPEFSLHAWVIRAKYDENQQYRSKTHGDREAGAQQDAGHYGQWTHNKFSEAVN